MKAIWLQRLAKKEGWMINENRMVPAGAFDDILSEIAPERERQISKGHTPETDDGLPALVLRHKARNRLTHKANRQELIEAALLIDRDPAHRSRSSRPG